MAYWQLKKRVEQYKKLVGRKGKDVPDELIELKKQINISEAEIAKMKANGEPETIIAEKVLDLGVLKTRYRTAIKEYDNK